MFKKIKSVILISLIPLLLSGCWDRVEIEERGFVVGMAIDIPDKEKDRKHPRFEVTYQYVIPAGMGGPNQGAQGDPFKNITVADESLFEAGREAAKQISRTPYLVHMQVLIISEEVLKKENAIENILDFYIRDHELRRSIKILVARDGSAKEILEKKTKLEQLPSVYINSISENNFKTAKLLKPTIVGDVHEYLLEKNNYVLPAIKTSKVGVELEGAAVFKGDSNSFIGYLEEDEIIGLNFITSEVKGGAFNAEYKEGLIVYEIERADSKIDPIIKSDDNIEFNITIHTEGKIVQSYKPIDFFDQKEIEKIEKQLEEKVISTIQNTIDRTQKELKVDVLGLNRILEQKRFEAWKKVRKQWNRGEGTFPSSKIHVSANVIIRTTGAASNTSE